MLWWTAGGILLMNALAQVEGTTGPFGDAQWLRDPVFENAPILNLLHKEKQPSPPLTGPQNVHTLFRKEIVLKDAPKQALLAITGDDYYKFYINGVFVVQGPEAGYSFAHPYYWLDVTGFLTVGRNCLASHSYYQGLVNRVWNSGDNRAGFMMNLDVVYEDGRRERYATDPTWMCRTLDAFTSSEPIGYKTQFIENIDLRKMPVAWDRPGFDDTAWSKPIAGFQDHQYSQQITPPLQVYRMDPKTKKTVAAGRYWYDFGGEIVGHTRIRLRGESGQTIKVRHGEELLESGEVRHEMRASCVYEEEVTLSGGEDLVEFYDYRAFRYIEILNAPMEPEVWVDVRHYPFPEGAAVLKSSNRLLEDIWRICSRGVQMGSQGGFLDCPSREKGAYLGDVVITARSQMWLTGDPRLTKKTLTDFMYSNRICPGLMAVAPCNFMQEIGDYSLQYPLLLWEYYRHSGDKEFLRTAAEVVFPGLFQYFAQYENATGVLAGYKDKWVVLDWPEELRDGYDYDLANTGENTVLNAFYYGALRKAAEIQHELGGDSAPYDARAERIAAAFKERFADPATGLYLDAPGSKHSSLHANAIPLAFGLTAGADPAKMLALIEEKKLSCGVYIASYVIEACFKNGASDLGYRLLTSEDKHSWSEMLRNGATTCMEVWGPDQKWNTSWCHPWSSSPIYLLSEYVMGLSPAEPGWGKIRVAPPIIKELPSLELTVPHPKGKITARHTPGQGWRYTVPQGVPAETLAPPNVPVFIEQEPSHATPQLSQEDRAFLEEQQWAAKVGDKLGVWVDMDQQKVYVLRGMEPVWQARCATSAWGAGAALDSNQTPLGWHTVAQKIGDGAPWGQVFRAKRPTAEIWRPGQAAPEDLVLTRILCLAGSEPGRNQGKDEKGRVVDSKERNIYIHGTNGEDRIGTPSSHGCIRLRNDDVLEAYACVPAGAPVLISTRHAGSGSTHACLAPPPEPPPAQRQEQQGGQSRAGQHEIGG